MPGFFSSESMTFKAPQSLIPKCGACQLYLHCQSPKMKVSGKGRKGILIVGEAGGAEEDRQGKQFVGPTGQLLERTLNNLGIDMREDCWMDNALACRPSDTNEIKDRRQIDHCRPKLLKTIYDLQPNVIILLGKSAVRSVIGGLWKEDVGPIGQWVGWQIPCHKPNAWLCPTWHPSYLLREENPVLSRFFEDHLRSAVSLSEKPWESPPRFEDAVETILDASEAASVIREITRKGGLTAFDYETMGLKPDSEHLDIICASICWRGKRTIAFPWHGEVIPAVKEMLRADNVGTIYSNAKFEYRWTLKKLGIRIKNVAWDTMLNAHILDCRPGITGLKFQAFIRLGMLAYDERIKPYLKAKIPGGNSPNRIRECDFKQLLKYCGLDSLLEYKVARQQMRELGIKHAIRGNE